MAHRGWTWDFPPFTYPRRRNRNFIVNSISVGGYPSPSTTQFEPKYDRIWSTGTTQPPLRWSKLMRVAQWDKLCKRSEPVRIDKKYLLSYLLHRAKPLGSWLINQLVRSIPSVLCNPTVNCHIYKCRHLSLSLARSIQYIPHPTSWRSILILSSHLEKRYLDKI